MAYYNEFATRKPGGWIMIDNRASGGTLLEMDTFQCPHCQRIVVKHPERTRPRNTCRKCMKVTCDSAPCRLECDHWEKKLEQGRPWLLPQQVPDDKAEEWFPKAIRGKTPNIWLPRRLRGQGI